MENVPFYLAFAAGALSFLSPCCLGLFPSYISFISGSSLETLISHERKRQVIIKTLSHSLPFILGFTVLFMIMGSTMSYVGHLFLQYRKWIRITGGVIIILFALTSVGIMHLKFLLKERRYHFRKKPVGYFGSFLVGLGFAGGWIPCSGPTLSAILFYATAEASALYGMKLLGFYSLGLAVPFLVFGLFINLFLSKMEFLKRHQKAFVYLNALVMIAFGIMLMTGYIVMFQYWVPDLGIEF